MCFMYIIPKDHSIHTCNTCMWYMRITKDANTSMRVSTIYRMAGNIGGNYIVRFHEKITGFLFAELNIALYCVHSVTPMH